MVSLVMDSPSGPLELGEEGGAITALEWTDAPADEVPTSPLLAEAKRQLAAYFAGRRSTFDLPLAPRGSDFRNRVWRALRAIPYGQTRTYGEIAATISSAPRRGRRVRCQPHRDHHPLSPGGGRERLAGWFFRRRRRDHQADAARA